MDDLAGSANSANILLITNETCGEGEDVILAKELSFFFKNIRLLDASRPIAESLAQYDMFIIRNAWASPGMYKRQFDEIFMISKEKGIPVYNSLTRKIGFYDDKRYLKVLMDEGYPVIPSYLDIKNIPDNIPLIMKPLDGCSSYGIRFFEDKSRIPDDACNGHIIQPLLELKNEASFFFINNIFSYALITEGNGISNRWNLREFDPSPEQIATAEKFIKWDAMEYGISRIDFGMTNQNEMLLMEIENSMCFLSLAELSRSTLELAISALASSIKNSLHHPP